MAQSSQRRAIANYRRRQGERGLCRYEVRELDPDKPLVRLIAARLAANDPDAQRLRAELAQEVTGEQPRRGGIFAALRRSPMVGVELDLFAGMSPKVVTSTGGTLPDRHEHRRRSDAASSVSGCDDVVRVRRMITTCLSATLTLGELGWGILQLPVGRRRREREAWFAGPEGPPLLFAHRVLSFDTATASVWARLMAEGHAGGRSRSAMDMIIAATAVVHDCVVVTANERHFHDVVAFINPTAST